LFTLLNCLKSNASLFKQLQLGLRTSFLTEIRGGTTIW
jgi:hypothetical protein